MMDVPQERPDPEPDDAGGVREPRGNGPGLSAWRPTRFWHQVVIFTVVVLVGLPFALYQSRPDVYNEGMAVLGEAGPGAAEIYFEPWASSGDLEAMFGAAWTIYLKGDHERADRLATYIAIETRHEGLKARALFLLGTLEMIYGNNDMASDRFGESMRIYSQIKNPLGVFRCRLNLAAARIYAGDTMAAHEILAKTDISPYGGEDKAYFCFLASQTAYQLGKVDEASAMAQKSLDHYREVGHRSGETNILAEWGYQLILEGHLDKGKAMTDEALKILNPADENKGSYIRVNIVLWSRCMGEAPTVLTQEIRTRAENDRDRLLLRHLTRALNHKCKG